MNMDDFNHRNLGSLLGIRRVGITLNRVVNMVVFRVCSFIRERLFFLAMSMFSLAMLMSFAGCNQMETKKQISGKTMGTTYHISYFGQPAPSVVKKAVDSLMLALNAEVSTYIPSSTISQFNANPSDTVVIAATHHYFWDNFAKAKEIYSLTEGYFDPTVMPLVNYWGFGYKGHRPVEEVDSMVVDSLLQMVGFDQLRRRGDTIFRLTPHVQLDFSALAKGYGVDVVAAWFDEHGVERYFVEIGGENRAFGRKPNDQKWTVGISIPKEGAGIDAYNTVVELDNRAMATSGNYRNFYEVNGQKFSHTINPKTGFSERNTILSASVLAENCMTADALATAMMAMGHEKAKKLEKSLESIDVILKIGLPDGNIKTEFSNPALKK
ncbi:MAG TPA: FAD:protein FMN transferase [Saprospiraceae bacterium]|nr:FAD:protein FMN transferase [Saprospiraceae bacterium]